MAEVEETIETPEIAKGIKASHVREIDKKAEKMRDRTILPKFPGSRIDERQWEEWARLLTPEMWTRLALYIYRTYPNIIRQLSDPRNDNNIDICTEVVDIRKHITELLGGGKYRIDVNDSGKKIGEIRVNIPIHEFEPKLNYVELDLFAKENQAYIQSLKYRGILGEDGKPRPGGANPPTPATTPSMQDMMGMLDRFAGMMEKMGNREREELRRQVEASKDQGLNGAVAELFLEKLKQDNPNNSSTIIKDTLALAKEVMGPKQEKDDSKVFELFKQMLDMQQKHSEQMITILKEKGEKPEPGEKILDSVDAAMSIMERLSSLQGGGGKRSGWDTGLEYAKELGLPIFNAISQIYTVYKMGKPMDATIQQQPGQPVKPTGKTISGMEAAANAGRIAAGQKPAMYTGEPTEPIKTGYGEAEVLPAVDPQLMGMLNMAAGPILKFMADDRSGADLALVLIEMYGKPSHAQLANYGEDKILEAAKSVPEFWANFAVYGEDKVKQFLNEFIHYEEFLEEEGEINEETEDKSNSKSKNKKK